MKTELKQLLNITTDLHGFWLINHQELIEHQLKSDLQKFGFSEMTLKLKNPEYCTPLYHSIRSQKT